VSIAANLAFVASQTPSFAALPGVGQHHVIAS